MADIEPIKGNIIVSVNLMQKDEALIGGNLLKTGRNYNENFRERNPVIAKVEKGNKEIPTGSHIVCNYSFFDLESPMAVFDNLYSIPVNEQIFAIVKEDGSLIPVCGNVLVERINKESAIDLPEDLVKEQINQGVAVSGKFNGKHIFFLPYSNYEICFNWNGDERRAIKIHETEITGYLKK